MELKKFAGRLKTDLLKSKSNFLIVLGIVGLVLILISSFDFSESGSTVKTQGSQVSFKSESLEYTEMLEEKLETVISDMLGNSPVTVMVTLESSTEYVFADEIKTDADVYKDQSAFKIEQSDSNQKTYIVVKDADGNESPVIVTEIMPIVRGVVVVCENGETPAVAAAVRLAVKSALNIDDTKICVIGRH